MGSVHVALTLLEREKKHLGCGGCAEGVEGGARAPARAGAAECQRGCGMPVAGAALHDKQPREEKKPGLEREGTRDNDA